MSCQKYPTIKKSTILFIALLAPLLAQASDFSGLLVFILVPFIIIAGIVWLSTWLFTRDLKPWWLKAFIRTVGLCLIFTPTHTSGGNGKMPSAALFDIVFSGMGGDPVYAKQALINVAVTIPVVFAMVLLVRLFNKKQNRS